MQIDRAGRERVEQARAFDHALDLLVGRHHDHDDFGVLADLGGRGAVPDAVVLGAPHRVGIDVVAGDVEALAQHVPGELYPHGAEPDHAGALDWICLIHGHPLSLLPVRSRVCSRRFVRLQCTLLFVLFIRFPL